MPNGVAFVSAQVIFADDNVDAVFDWHRGDSVAGSRVNFALADDNGSASGMWSPIGSVYYGGYFYNSLLVVDRQSDRVFAYGLWSRHVGDGEFVSVRVRRLEDLDFSLDPANDRAEGITRRGGSFWIVDLEDDKVYAYETRTGVRQPARDFDLTHGSRVRAFGISHPQLPLNVERFDLPIWNFFDYFYVVDDETDTVYAYDDAGNRAASHDFELAVGNDDPRGIEAVSVFVHDSFPDVVPPDLDDRDAWQPALSFFVTDRRTFLWTYVCSLDSEEERKCLAFHPDGLIGASGFRVEREGIGVEFGPPRWK